MKKLFIPLLFISFSSYIFAEKEIHFVILHTNDTHSQVEPNKDDSGGYARRLGEINFIRNQEKNVLLFDAGDFFQGTPYFNFYNGNIEIEAMNKMGYDAGTIGNHEFDDGMDTLAKVLKKADFPFVNANYNVVNTPLNNLLKSYIIIKKAGLKIGVFGVGVKPEGLIFQKNYKGLLYENPVQKAIEISNLLKNKEKCDLIVCLSHLGTDSTDVNPTDWNIAKATKDIDIIIGGHSHQVIVNKIENNADGKPVIIAQMGKSGVYLGRIDLTFEKK